MLSGYILIFCWFSINQFNESTFFDELNSQLFSQVLCHGVSCWVGILDPTGIISMRDPSSTDPQKASKGPACLWVQETTAMKQHGFLPSADGFAWSFLPMIWSRWAPCQEKIPHDWFTDFQMILILAIRVPKSKIFRHFNHPYAPCMVYLLTFGQFLGQM